MKKIFFSIVGLILTSNVAHAISVDWGGSYRFEYVTVDTPYLSSGAPAGNKGTKSYFLNHLNLSPKIIAMDGLNIVANLEVFPASKYPGSQLGSDFGNADSTATTSYAGGNNQGASSIEVNQLYMNWVHEYGALLAGRAPIQFGLGMTHNAGQGIYDHWNQSRDMVGYKFIIGNLSIMPSLGRTYRNNNYSLIGGTTEQMWNIDYTNPETESTFAIYQQVKSGGVSANDGDKYLMPYFPTGAVTGGWNTTHTNLFIARGWEKFKFKLEAGFQTGGTGVTPTGGTEVKLGGYGIVMDFDFPRPEIKWQWNVKLGVASGDNPATNDQFEGYSFSKNYDVAFLLFNHPMGNADTLRSKLARTRKATLPAQVYGNDDVPDDEVITNAIFFAPKFDYVMSDRWTWTNSMVYASTQTAPATNVASDLGFEWDTGFVYKPHPKVRWATDIGLFFPGQAFKNATSNYDINFNYGIQTKAAVSF